LEPSIESEKDLTSKIIKESDNFIEAHRNMSNYVFQVKKCKNSSFLHCSHHPVRMSAEDFEALCFLPLPLLDSKNESYLPFSEMYGQKPSEKDLKVHIVFRRQRNLTPEGNLYLIMAKSVALLPAGNV